MMIQTNTKLNHLIKGVNYFMRLSPPPHSGQIWGVLPSSTITCNIYKPLKRINLQGSGGGSASNHQDQAFRLCDCGFNGPVRRRAVSITLLWDEGPCWSRVSPQQTQGSAEARGLSWDRHFWQTLRRYSAPLLMLQPPFIPGPEKVSLSGCSDYCEGESQLCCMPLLSSLCGCLQMVTGLRVFMAFQWKQLLEGG